MSLRGPVALSVVVPVHDGAAHLDACLSALEASDLPRASWELLVVDDASTDGSAIIAARHADAVVRLRDEARGPAYARNRGIEVATGELVAFVDADVRVSPGTLRALRDALQAEPGLAAVSCTYDDRAAGAGFVSAYRNLLLHHLQHEGADDASFFSACGMVRREALLRAGMFDEWRFPRAQVEDLELGLRLRLLGYTLRLLRDVRVGHLKRWSLAGALAADIRDRAVPWMRVLGRRDGRTDLLSPRVMTSTPVRTIGVVLAVAAGIAGLATGDRRLQGACVALLLAGCVANARLLARFARARGPFFALAAAPLHLLFELVSGLALATGWVIYHLVGDPRPDPTLEAFAEVGVRTWPPVPARRSTEAAPVGAPPR